MKKPNIKQILNSEKLIGKPVEVSGWVRTKRESKNVAFIALNDGSCLTSLQIVADWSKISEDVLKEIHTGTSVVVKGQLVESQGKGQKVEVLAESLKILGKADPDEYPLQPKRHSLEFLREIAHLRFRTNTFGAVFRIRHSLAFAVHKYFNDRDFFYIHSPIITGSDAEGAGEMFQVTTLDLQNVPKTESGEVDYSKDFFAKPANLTVSGQLEAELAAMGLSKVYTFGPTFRAENSNTTRHLAEFWMIEPEMAFYDIHDNMDLAEDFLKYCIRYVLENNPEDLAFLEKRLLDEEKTKPQNERSAKPLIEKLKTVIETEFERITYTEAVDILKNSKPNKKKKFQYPVNEWGVDLQSEHERYLVEKHFQKPVIIRDYPKEIKAFYMRLNEDGKTVRGMDVLFPGIGEIIGGSQREERLDYLMEGIKRFHIPEETMWWYIETRKFGSVPHSGFGLGFERLVQFVTGMSNIRDVIPFPRYPKHLEF
ncbi:MAG: asparagine--tRNA ligase [Bacteroidetes bacterium]|nr:MAG: asparagine--tRNA ligase [Bacteroidota bacterium]